MGSSAEGFAVPANVARTLASLDGRHDRHLDGVTLVLADAGTRTPEVAR